jgi:hypothetical protein
MHQERLAFNKTLLLKLLHVLIFKSLERIALYDTIITYKHTTRINKKQSPNSTNRTKQWHKTNLRFETVART